MLLFITSFEEYGEFLLPSPGTAANPFLIDATGGRFGRKAITNVLSTDNKAFVLIDVPTTHGRIFTEQDWSAQITVGFAYKFSIAGQDTCLVKLVDDYLNSPVPDQVVQLELHKDANDVLNIQCQGVVLARGTTPLAPNRYYFLEWRAQINGYSTLIIDLATQTARIRTYEGSLYNATAHQNQLYIDGSLECEIADGTPGVGYLYPNEDSPPEPVVPDPGGIYYIYYIAPPPDQPGDTDILGAAYVPGFAHVWLFAGSFRLQNWWTDLYVNTDSGSYNNGQLGDSRSALITVDGQGSHTDWTNVGGATAVDSVADVEPDYDATYVYSQRDTDAETFTFTSMPTGSDVVIGVMTAINVDVDSFTGHDLSMTCVGQTAVPTGVDLQTYVRIVAPFDGPWTETTVDSLEAGFTLVS